MAPSALRGKARSRGAPSRTIREDWRAAMSLRSGRQTSIRFRLVTARRAHLGSAGPRLPNTPTRGLARSLRFAKHELVHRFLVLGGHGQHLARLVPAMWDAPALHLGRHVVDVLGRPIVEVVVNPCTSVVGPDCWRSLQIQISRHEHRSASPFGPPVHGERRSSERLSCSVRLAARRRRVSPREPVDVDRHFGIERDPVLAGVSADLRPAHLSAPQTRRSGTRSRAVCAGHRGHRSGGPPARPRKLPPRRNPTSVHARRPRGAVEPNIKIY